MTRARDRKACDLNLSNSFLGELGWKRCIDTYHKPFIVYSVEIMFSRKTHFAVTTNNFLRVDMCLATRMTFKHITVRSYQVMTWKHVKTRNEMSAQFHNALCLRSRRPYGHISVHFSSGNFGVPKHLTSSKSCYITCQAKRSYFVIWPKRTASEHSKSYFIRYSRPSIW